MARAQRKEERVGEKDVIYSPDAVEEQDRAALSEDEAFEDVHPGATAETYAAQTGKDRSHYPGATPEEGREKAIREQGGTKGSADPRQQGRRS